MPCDEEETEGCCWGATPVATGGDGRLRRTLRCQPATRQGIRARCTPRATTHVSEREGFPGLRARNPRLFKYLNPVVWMVL